jgi:hypothetical protein
MGELASPPVEVGIGRPNQRLIRSLGYDFGMAEKRSRALKKVRKRQRKIHHATREHSFSPSGGSSWHIVHE